jgi:hypothetical protein
MRSLKKASPLFVGVAILIGYFWLLFAIIGVQSFKSSLRRSCVWADSEGVQANYSTISPAMRTLQFCGGQLNNITGDPEPWVYPNGSSRAKSHNRSSLCSSL